MDVTFKETVVHIQRDHVIAHFHLQVCVQQIQRYLYTKQN